jgi:hypothetical protein
MTIEEMRTIDAVKTWKELEEAKERIKRLEDYGNALVAHVYAYRTQRQWTEESYHDLIQTIADWDKAKANKP